MEPAERELSPEVVGLEKRHCTTKCVPQGENFLSLPIGVSPCFCFSQLDLLLSFLSHLKRRKKSREAMGGERAARAPKGPTTELEALFSPES